MDESSLADRLATIERRQSLALALLVGGYVIGGLWFLVREVAAVTVWHVVVGGVVLGIIALAVGTYRRRRSRE